MDLPVDARWFAASLVALLLLAAGFRIRGVLDRLRQRARQRRAARGEQRAFPLLESRGYRVVDSQPPAQLMLRVDGEAQEIALRADYLVERAGRRYVAEVKTGRHAPNPRNPDTRRQLLEYRLAYDVAGVLLIDMERRSIHRVDFMLDGGTRPRLPLAWLALGGLLGALGAHFL
ncbi:MAG: hypothetical protein OXT09_30100 [Myxococcales bacterium]|nr:hypothetical protein [Myxococcales bacterium]